MKIVHIELEYWDRNICVIRIYKLNVSCSSLFVCEWSIIKILAIFYSLNVTLSSNFIRASKWIVKIHLGYDLLNMPQREFLIVALQKYTFVVNEDRCIIAEWIRAQWNIPCEDKLICVSSILTKGWNDGINLAYYAKFIWLTTRLVYIY